MGGKEKLLQVNLYLAIGIGNCFFEKLYECIKLSLSLSLFLSLSSASLSICYCLFFSLSESINAFLSPSSCLLCLCLHYSVKCTLNSSRVSQLRLKFFALCALLIFFPSLPLSLSLSLFCSLSFLACNLLQLCKCRTREHFVLCFVRLRGVAACPLLPSPPSCCSLPLCSDPKCLPQQVKKNASVDKA